MTLNQMDGGEWFDRLWKIVLSQFDMWKAHVSFENKQFKFWLENATNEKYLTISTMMQSSYS